MTSGSDIRNQQELEVPRIPKSTAKISSPYRTLYIIKPYIPLALSFLSLHKCSHDHLLFLINPVLCFWFISSFSKFSLKYMCFVRITWILTSTFSDSFSQNQNDGKIRQYFVAFDMLVLSSKYRKLIDSLYK